jgi:hypothetical protein
MQKINNRTFEMDTKIIKQPVFDIINLNGHQNNRTFEKLIIQNIVISNSYKSTKQIHQNKFKTSHLSDSVNVHIFHTVGFLYTSMSFIIFINVIDIIKFYKIK